VNFSHGLVEIAVFWTTREDLGMAKLASNKVGWNRSSATDVVGYRLRIKEAPGSVDYADPAVDVGNVDQFDFATSPGFAGVDSVFNLGVTAVDDGGNESDISRLDAFPLDLVPPDAPTNVRRF
jgi:hypothetical protein